MEHSVPPSGDQNFEHLYLRNWRTKFKQFFYSSR